MKFWYGFALGLILVTLIGFKLYGWHTKGDVEAIAQSAMKHSAMCVADFVKAPGYDARVKELTGKNRFEYADYITKGGWGKPAEGEAPSARPYHDACAEAIVKLVNK